MSLLRGLSSVATIAGRNGTGGFRSRPLLFPLSKIDDVRDAPVIPAPPYPMDKCDRVVRLLLRNRMRRSHSPDRAAVT